MASTLAARNQLNAAENPVTAAPTSEQLTAVQMLLNRLGYGPVAVNGTLDTATTAALTAFLKAQGLTWTPETPIDFNTLAAGMQTQVEKGETSKRAAPTDVIASKLKAVPSWVWFAGGALAVGWYINSRMSGDSIPEPAAEPSEGHISALSAHVKPVKVTKRRKGNRLPELTADELSAGTKVAEVAAEVV